MRIEQGPKWFDEKLHKEVSKHLFCRRLVDRAGGDRWAIYHDGFGARPQPQMVLLCEDRDKDVALEDGWIIKTLIACDRARFLGNMEPRMEALTLLEEKLADKSLGRTERIQLEYQHKAMIDEAEVMFKDWLRYLAAQQAAEERDKARQRGEVIREMAEGFRAAAKGRIVCPVPGEMGIV